MKTLLIDGTWVLKKNYHKKKGLTSNGLLCGGSFGFLESLKSVINKTLPDRVVVMWDGFNAGKFRYEIYKPYKANRKKDWDAEYNALSSGGIESEEDREKYEIASQAEVVKSFLYEFSIRCAEAKYIEADDLIAYYILESKIPNEEIVIYSRDKDFLQLIDDKVSILSPDNFELITKENFKDKFGYLVENALLFKCFEGDVSDGIVGVKGVTSNKLLEHFPLMESEKYMYDRLVEECYDKKRKKKIKLYDKIIQSRGILYRNAKLMNLKKPFVNEDAKKSVKLAINGVFTEKKSLKSAMDLFFKLGFNKFVQNEFIDLFFAPYFRIVNKEREFCSVNLKI